jgi:hypothetical protein
MSRLPPRLAALFDAGLPHDTTGGGVVLAAVPRKQARRFALFTSATAVAILVQAVLAGMFINQDGKDTWVTVHGVVADVSWVMALVTAVLGWVTMRSYRPSLVFWSVVLFLATLLEAGIGHLLPTDNYNWLIPVHVPLAFLIFALTIWLTTRALSLRRDPEVIA